MSTVEYIKDPVYTNEEGTIIDCLVKFDTVPTELPFTADKFDVEPHGREIWQQCKDGVWGSVAPYVPPPPLIVQIENGPTVA